MRTAAIAFIASLMLFTADCAHAPPGEQRVAAAAGASGAGEAMAAFREQTPIPFFPMCPR